MKTPSSPEIPEPGAHDAWKSYAWPGSFLCSSLYALHPDWARWALLWHPIPNWFSGWGDRKVSFVQHKAEHPKMPSTQKGPVKGRGTAPPGAGMPTDNPTQPGPYPASLQLIRNLTQVKVKSSFGWQNGSQGTSSVMLILTKLQNQYLLAKHNQHQHIPPHSSQSELRGRGGSLHSDTDQLYRLTLQCFLGTSWLSLLQAAWPLSASVFKNKIQTQ